MEKFDLILIIIYGIISILFSLSLILRIYNDLKFIKKKGCINENTKFCFKCGHHFNFDESMNRIDKKYNDLPAQVYRGVMIKEVKLKINSLENFLDFMRIFESFTEIDIQYYWDQSDSVDKLKKEGYTSEEIVNEFGYINNRDYDEEYSFCGSYEELINYTTKYDCYDNLCCDSIESIKIEINEDRYKVYIVLLVF